MRNNQFIILIVTIIFLSVGIFTSYYFLVAKPKIKADCLNAAIQVVDSGESVRRSTDLGENIEFDKEKYNDCIQPF